MDEVREKTGNTIILVFLFIFGAYLSILFYAYQAVPNPDFTSFVDTGRQLLSFHLPSHYKRAPVLGILLVGLGHIIGGPQPELTAGWVINACILPLNLVLLWLVGKMILGWPAVWIALIAIINPWVLAMAIDPVVETLFLFCILLSFYAIFRRSRWAYLAASVTTMVRYEGVLIILIVFAVDMVERKNRENWLRPFLYSVFASIPLGVWMLGTLLNWQTQNITHYLKGITPGNSAEITWSEYIRLIWGMGVRHLFETDAIGPKALDIVVERLSKGLILLSFVFGLGYGLLKRNWKVVALALFLGGYVFIHAAHGVLRPRYCVPVFWIVLILCVYGMTNGWSWIKRAKIIPENSIWVFQGMAFIVFLGWLILLILHVSEIAHISRRSISVAYVFSGFVGLILWVQSVFFGQKVWLKNITIALLIVLIGFSNQYQLVKTLKDGKQDLEFKLLAEWYMKNAKAGDKMVTTMSNIVQIFAPASKEAFVHYADLPAATTKEFIEACYSKSIDYVVWDSRVGFRPESGYFRRWHLKNVKALEKPMNDGPFRFVAQISINKKQFVNIFQLKERFW
jgi:hypothetical protein